MPDLRTLSPLDRRESLRWVAFPSFFPSRMLPDLLALAADWPPDLIVRDNLEFAGCVAAEHWGVPHAAVRVVPEYWRLRREDEQARFVPALDALRASVGLPPDLEAAMLHRYLYLVCAPPQFDAPDESLPPTSHRPRRAIFDRCGDETLPTWVADLPPERPVVFATLGTAYYRHTEVFALLLAALRDEPISLIVTIGRNQDPAQFGPQPAHVHIEWYIPLSLLLPHCDLVINQGGFSTVTTTLLHGLPMVLIPLWADQPQNAQSCARLGVSEVIGPDDRTAGAIREAARAVLANPTYRRNAERVRDAMAALPGPEYAVALLERLAREKAPLIAAS